MTSVGTKKILATLFLDKDKKVVIAQAPNLPIIGWAVLTALALLFQHSQAKLGMSSLAHAFLFVWAYLEIRSGDSLFRRILGAAVLLFVLTGYFT